jgi:hypothetical protein
MELLRPETFLLKLVVRILYRHDVKMNRQAIEDAG